MTTYPLLQSKQVPRLLDVDEVAHKPGRELLLLLLVLLHNTGCVRDQGITVCVCVCTS
jgi:hypothetical protein